MGAAFLLIQRKARIFQFVPFIFLPACHFSAQGKLQRLSTDAMPCVSAKEALQLASVSNPDEWESLIGSIPALETLSQAEQAWRWWFSCERRGPGLACHDMALTQQSFSTANSSCNARGFELFGISLLPGNQQPNKDPSYSVNR